MPGWADDPELLATFRAEVEERVASLSAGLLALETHPSPRQVIASLFRDAHTVKGSARMLGLSAVLQVAHSCEDVLGALRDGRFGVRRDIIDVLLASCDGMTSALPGVEDPAPDEHLAALADALGQVLAGVDPVQVPRWTPERQSDDDDDEPGRGRSSESVRVATDKVYELLDVVGEAELDARRVERASSELDALALEHTKWLRLLRAGAGTLDGEAALAVNRLLAVGDELTAATRDLRELVDGAHGRLAQVRDGAMGLAMVPVRRVVAGLPRVVRDIAATTGKDVRLALVGEDVELDKKVLDGVSDALKHLVVNAVDHGCESAEERVAAGKPAQATVTVAARAAGGTVVIEVSDDGAGIDEDALRRQALALGIINDPALAGPALWQVLFVPAFSTASEVTETSGRGVGLDVVRTAVEALGGSVDLRSTRGQGTTFLLTLPVTLGVLRCLIARVGQERYALPVPGVVESVSLKDADVHVLAGKPVVVRHGATLPLLDLGAALDVPGERQASAAVVVRHADRQVAWAVDRLEGELELVVKDLGPFLGRLPLVTGATIDGDGSVVFLVDLRELAGESVSRVVVQSAGSAAPAASAAVARKPRVLVVEDSVGVRELERVILEGAGYEVTTAVDGLDGASRLKGDPADLVVSDVEMPGMDGYTLTRTIRRTRGWEQVPVVIMTSRGSEEDQRAGLEAGASAYLLKTEFDQNQLVETVQRLIGR
jgi:chemotaxis protein histidine kinase CheA